MTFTYVLILIGHICLWGILIRIISGRFIYSVSHSAFILFLMVSDPILGVKNIKIKRRAFHPWELTVYPCYREVSQSMMTAVDEGTVEVQPAVMGAQKRNVDEGLSIQFRRSEMSYTFRSSWNLRKVLKWQGASFRKSRREGCSGHDERHSGQGKLGGLRDL